jgi:ribosomal protein S25
MDLKAKFAQVVREMSDDEIMALVSAAGGVDGVVTGSSNGQSIKPVARRRKVSKAQARQHKKAQRAAKKATKKARTRRSNGAAADPKLPAKVATFVKRSKGVSVSEVAANFSIDKLKAAAILKKLLEDETIARGGQRRFTRYAKNEDIAKLASLRARGKTTAGA